MFERLPAAALDRLVLAFESHHLSDGEVIFSQGDDGDRLYLVESGAVNLLRTDGNHSRLLARIDAGGYFGELALLSDNPRTATAQCAGETELLSISGRDLKRLVAESAPALRSIVGAIKEYRPAEQSPSLWARLRGRGKSPAAGKKKAGKEHKAPAGTPATEPPTGDEEPLV
jgi:CRP-like cAMP-binding protein